MDLELIAPASVDPRAEAWYERTPARADLRLKLRPGNGGEGIFHRFQNRGLACARLRGQLILLLHPAAAKLIGQIQQKSEPALRRGLVRIASLTSQFSAISLSGQIQLHTLYRKTGAERLQSAFPRIFGQLECRIHRKSARIEAAVRFGRRVEDTVVSHDSRPFCRLAIVTGLQKWVQLPGLLRPLQNAEGDSALVGVEVECCKGASSLEKRSEPHKPQNRRESGIED